MYITRVINIGETSIEAQVLVCVLY